MLQFIPYIGTNELVISEIYYFVCMHSNSTDVMLVNKNVQHITYKCAKDVLCI
jgi:hypothetical protein